MDDFNNCNKLDYQKDPLDSKNLNGVHWNETFRKTPPLLNSNEENCNNEKLENSLNSLTFIAYLFLGFLALMSLTWLYRVIKSYFFGL